MKLKIPILSLLLLFSASATKAQVVEQSKLPAKTIDTVKVDSTAATAKPAGKTPIADTTAAKAVKVDSTAVTAKPADSTAIADTTMAKAVTADSTAVTAQPADSTTIADTTAAKAKVKRIIDRPRLKIGLRTGLNFADMVYSHEPIGRYDHTSRTTGLMGVFAEVSLGNSPISLRPEVAFVTRGNHINWFDVEYDFSAQYIDFRLPVTWNFWFRDEHISPYLMAVPQFNLPYGGVITYSADDFSNRVSTPITSADLRNMDFSVMLGAGIDFRIDFERMPIYASVEVGHNFGMLNNFAPREMIETTQTPSNILNDFFGAELWHGERHTRGLEWVLRVAVPLDSKFLERYRNRHKVSPDTIYRLERDTIMTPAPVQERIVEVGYRTKECFTTSEITEMLEQGTDITGMRICMFDIKFDFDSYTIRKESEVPLNRLVKMMQDYPQMIVEVYGHTDSIGTAEYNQRLSENRAQAVVDYLSKKGISPNRVRSFGYGLRYPIDTNTTEEGRFRNRRVEFEVINIGLKRKYKD